MFKAKAELIDPEAATVVATFTEDGGRMKVVLKHPQTLSSTARLAIYSTEKDQELIAVTAKDGKDTVVHEFHGVSSLGALTNGAEISLTRSPGGPLGSLLEVLGRGTVRREHHRSDGCAAGTAISDGRTQPSSAGRYIMALTEQIAAKAEVIVNTLTQTDYQHTDNIVPATGVYDCDCNGFAGFVLSSVAPKHFGLIKPEPGQPRPRAFVYYDFFAALTPDSAGGWRRVDMLTDARRGDIMAWRFPTVEEHEDTGHVVVVADTPKLDPSGDFFVVRVYDSAAEAHFEDTRAPNGQPSPKGKTGVGSGFINVKVDGAGRPIAYLFAPPATAQYSYRPIAIGRAQPL